MNDQIKQKYMELQILSEEINQIETYIKNLQNQLIELTGVGEALIEFSNSNKGKSLLAPLGAGLFVKSQIQDTNSVLMNIGSNTVIKKSIPGAKKIIDEQLTKLNKLIENIQSNNLKANQYKNNLIHELQHLQGTCTNEH